MKEILLVEDSDRDADFVRRALMRVGVVNSVRRLVNGVEAMAYLEHALEAAPIGPAVPSILLLDLKLPGMSGFDILERMTNREGFRKTLRIVLSHMDDMKSIKRAYALGAHSFLTKPVSEEDLREVVEIFPGHWRFGWSAGPIPSSAVTLSC